MNRGSLCGLVIASVVGVLGMLGKWQVDVGHSIIVTKQKFNNYLYLRDLGVIVQQFVTECEAVGFSDTFGP